MAEKTASKTDKLCKSEPEVQVGFLPDDKGARSWWILLGGFVLLTAGTRLYKVDQPAWVCWDETHFGKMGSWYINRTFFFDVHPPLGKMMIAGLGYLSGYNGTHPFEKPGDLYEDHPYMGMRVGCTLLGCCIVPFSFLTVWELTGSLTASGLAATLLVFDIGLMTLNRYILLDPILLFFISGSVFAMAEFRSLSSSPFTKAWWFWLATTGAMLGGAISVKFVGLFVVLYVGIFTIMQLWDILGDMSKPIIYTVKHFMARAVCLIVLPLLIYVTFFYIHLTVLSKSGPGDGFYSSLFQTTLEGNRLNNATMPKEVAYEAVISLKNHRTGGGYLHSHYHLYPEGVGAKQQQVTSYAHKDENNYFVMKKWNEEPSQDDDTVDLVKSGDLVRLEHLSSKRNIHSHLEPAPISKRHYQVTGYGENGTGDANDVWRVEIVGGREGDIVNTLISRLKFHHYFVKCVLTCSGKNLPKWGFEQQEISCNPTTRDPNSEWNVEDNTFSKLPNVSLGVLSPSFISRFIESHRVMLQGNAGLKPKEGEYTSRPWEWPINLRGQWFSGNDVRVYLLGNPVIWWSNIILLLIFLAVFSFASLKAQRGYAEAEEEVVKRDKTLEAGAWLFVGWALHYVPFWTMGRVLYFHHYFPALLFSSMLSGVLLDYIVGVACNYAGALKGVVYHTDVGAVVGLAVYSFYLFSPLVYGMRDEYAKESNSSIHHLHWLASWEF